MPVKYLGIDPGESNGLAAYDESAKLIWMKTVGLSRLTDFLSKKVEFATGAFFIIEDYMVYPNKAQQHIYSNLATPRAIGRLEAFAEERGIKIVKQKAAIKSIGYKYIGKKPPTHSDPTSHVQDANVHAVYWLVNNGIIDPRSLIG